MLNFYFENIGAELLCAIPLPVIPIIQQGKLSSGFV